MDNNNFFRLLRSLTHLTPPQLERANEHIASHLRRDLLVQVLAERHNQLPKCPHCCSEKVIHWGHYKDIPRYRCKECSRTFNQLHNTSLARLKHKERWVLYARCLSEGLTLRKAAAVCHLSLSTSFRWRHRFLQYALTTRASRLAGIIEADEIFVPESFKGTRKMPRPPRKRGRKSQGRIPMVPVLIALDRYGHESDQVLIENSAEKISQTLQPLLSKGSVLCTDGNPSYIRIAKEATGISHKRLISLDKCRVIDGVFHIQTLNSYVSRWRLWMGRFYGVGTAYLQNYLAWFRVIEHKQSSCSSWLRGGVTPLTNSQ